MANYIKYYLRNIFYSTAILFTSVSVIQIFLGNLGIDSVRMGFFTSLLSVVNVLTSIGVSASADRVKNVRGTLTRICIPIGLCFILLASLGLIPDSNKQLIFLCTAALCLIQMFFMALYAVFEYKLPYHVIDMDKYGMFLSINGIVIGISNMAASVLLSEMLSRYPYRSVMTVGFALGGVCMALSMLLNSLLKTSKASATKTSAQEQDIIGSLNRIIKLDSFRWLIAPNLLRGIHMGLINVVAVIAVSKGFSVNTQSQLVTVAFSANIVGSVLFMLISKRPRNRLLCLIGTLLTAAGLFMASDSESVFLSAYFITAAGKIIVDYSVPARVSELIAPDIACLYHTWRLITTTIGTVLSTAVSGFFIEKCPIIVFLLLATLCQLISGVCYFIYNNRDSKEKQYDS